MRAKWQLKKTLALVPKPKITRAEKDPGLDPEYLDWIRSLVCAVKRYPFEGATICRGVVEAHHHTSGRGRGQKSEDRRSFPLCVKHHRREFHAPQWTGSRAQGSFYGWGKAKRREWQDAMVAKYQDRAAAIVQATEILKGAQ